VAFMNYEVANRATRSRPAWEGNDYLVLRGVLMASGVFLVWFPAF
jgi:hypothetical protein